ncbi:MAG: hypothetical protein ACQKBU_12695, partial [Verrucomicrobiales bacterium]
HPPRFPTLARSPLQPSFPTMKIPFDDDEQADAFFDELLSAVDQQLDSPETPYVRKTFTRLLQEEMSEPEAKEAIARCLAEITDQVVRSGRPFDPEAYRSSLERIKPES